jgi:tetratricopeptide (TPR) repeat protein
MPEAVLSAYYGLGLAFYEKGDFDEAIKALKESVRINPVNAFAHYYLGKALIHKGQIDEAIIAFNNFIIFAASEDAEYIEKARNFINLHKKER